MTKLVLAALLALLVPFALPIEAQSRPSESPLIEVRLASYEPAQGLRYAEVYGTDEIVYVSAGILFDDRDFERVTPTTTDEGVVLRVDFRRGRGQRLARVFRGEEDSRADALAVFAMGNLVDAVPVHVVPDYGNTPTFVMMRIPATGESAEILVRLIEERWGGG